MRVPLFGLLTLQVATSKSSTIKIVDGLQSTTVATRDSNQQREILNNRHPLLLQLEGLRK